MRETTKGNTMGKRIWAAFLAGVVLLTSLWVRVPEMTSYATDLPIDYTGPLPMDRFTFACIDSHELLGGKGGVYAGPDTGHPDIYKRVVPSSVLSPRDEAILFWAGIALFGSSGNGPDCVPVLEKANAAGAGISYSCGHPAFANDLKCLIHSDAYVAKYPWIMQCVNNAGTLLTAMGLMGSGGGGGSTSGGKTIPAALNGAITPATAVDISGTKSIDVGDPEFLSTVKIKYSTDGAEFTDSVPSGWASNVSGSVLSLDGTGTIYVKFDPTDTAYSVTASGGSFSSPEEVYDNCLELYTCVTCGGVHTSNPSPTPPGDHQRFIQFNFNTLPIQYYVRVGGGGTGGEVSFTIYNHSEDFVTHYNVELEKRDYETGEGLGGASFSLYERFDDRSNVDSDDGAEALCYQPSNNDGAGYQDSFDLMQSDWKKIASLTTNADGKANYTQEHKYHYQKTFCNGHPAPQFAEVPEPVIDPKNLGVPTNQAEIEEVQQANMELAQSWVDAVTACEDAASGSYAGIHFHFVMDGVDQSAIKATAASGGEPGDKPDGGSTSEPSDDEMFSASGCEADRDATAAKFAAQKYSYTVKEVTAANGYTLHDVHTDDIPIEIVKTDSSENGANSSFGGGYSTDVGDKNVGSGVKKLLAPKKAISKSASKSVSKPKEETEMFTSGEPFASSEPSLLMKAKEAVEKATDSIGKAVDEIIDFDAEDGLVSSIEKTFGLIIAEAAEADVIEIVTEEPDTEEENANVSEVSAVTFTPDEEAEVESVVEAVPAEAAVEAVAVEAAVAEETQESAKDIGLEALVIVDEEEETDGSSKALISFDSVKEFFAETLGMPLLGAPGGSGADFDSAYAAAYSTPSKGDDYSFGSSSEISHTWKVFDHRTEGEIHLNKQDMDLAAKSGIDYDAYADSNGDGTLEGAVYGLFAADDISHPDGHTGVVYAKNDLTAVATTDRDGNFSFMAYTVAPHQKFDYATGTIVSTGAGTGPSNLYGSTSSDTTTIDDYPADGKYVRTYPSNTRMNGNAWIGRPLMLGDYYVKELSRSEGYELSIEGKEDTLTNFGQDLDAGTSASTAYAKVTTKLFYPGQIDGLHVYGTAPDYSSPDYDEIYFDVTTYGTKTRGAFDLLFSKLPSGSKLYRLDQTSGTKTIQVPDKDGSGNVIYEPVYELDGGGNKIRVVAENDHQYMMLDPTTGIPLTHTAYPNKIVKSIPIAENKNLDPAACSTAVFQEEDSVWTAAEVALINDDLYDSGSHTRAEKDAFIKTKVEAALRANGYGTPVNGSGFSGRENQAIDEGNPATVPVVYGASRLDLTISGVGSLKVSQVINEILSYYNDNGYWNYGGIHSMSYSAGDLSLVLYADRKGASKGFKSTVYGKEMILSPVEHVGADNDSTRKIWAYYTKDTKETVAGLSIFGYYKDYSVSGAKMDATLVTEAVDNAPGTSDMTLVSKEILQNVYYSTGEAVYEWDSTAHALVPKYKITGYKVKTHPEPIPYDGNVWTDLSLAIPAAEPHLVTVPVTKDDTTDPQTYRFCLVVKTGSASELTRTLTAADIEKLPGTGWHAGNTMAISTYCVEVDQASVKAYADYASGVFGGASFVKAVTLEYPTQKYAGTSAGTLTKPLEVVERPIRQSVKIGKDIILNADTDGDGTMDSYRDNTYDYTEVVKQTNFRFKAYLKSNLERLYRNPAGEIVWMDRNGNEWEPVYGADGVTWKYKTAYGKKTVDFPEIGAKNTDGSTLFLNVQKLYTKEEYNRVLETETGKAESGASFAEIEQYNYQKFFDAISVANGDKWDDNAPTYTSWRPIGNKANRSAFAIDNAKRSDRVRQFAIDWYLKDEVAKQVKGVENSKIGGKYTENEAKRDLSANNYGDAVYDEALNKAIIKAENYLKPFFKYDLDKIYALSWDSELAGGKDTDLTTLSADLMNGDETYNYSAYLPYGDYIVVEQQPTYVGPSTAAFNDFLNKHYSIDRPKEVKVPSLYEGGISNAAADNYDPKYIFDITKENETWAAKDYLIRFGEEWNQNAAGMNSHVIRAHSYYGDFELYPYGLEVDFPSANDKEYARMLVPYTVVRSTSLAAYDNADFEGFADLNEHNTFYAAKLRIEKLDAETHENILHDDAIFAIYKAERDTTTGDVKFYSVDTDITGSKEFVAAYCDRTTVMPVDPADPSGEYRGTVKAGTPICAETGLITLTDEKGNETGEFKAFSTAQDIPAKTESGNVSTDPAAYLSQNTGYLELPQPLGAGVYVLLEKKAPAGYVRTAPVAVEVYSDKVTYYKESSKDKRIRAAVFDEDGTDEAKIFVEDAPIKLMVEKVKESSVSSADTTPDKTVTYRLSGREDGPVSSFTGRSDVAFAYDEAGHYQGYVWKKGTLEYLAGLKHRYDTDGDPLTGVKIVFTGTVFSGYGFVTVPLETADDTNRFASGATLTLYDAVRIRRNETYPFGDPSQGDLAFYGLKVNRDPSTGRVTRMYVEKGYAGVKTQFRKSGSIWNAETVERGDTDILYYDLDSLKVTFTDDLGAGDRLYGYDREGKPVDVARLTNDITAYHKTDREVSVFAFRGSEPVFEIAGGDLTKASYNAAEKFLLVDKDSVVYHLDTDGNRDAMVDPKTGMAYVIETCDDGHGGTCEQYLVWPVEIYRDSLGNVIAKDKITTSRVATIGENADAEKDALTEIPRAADPNGDAISGNAASYEHDETGSITGSWISNGTGESHHQTTDMVTKGGGKNLNQQTLLSDNNGAFVKQYSPVYDGFGNILYYQRGSGTYDKGADIYDRDGIFVRYDSSDQLPDYSVNAYRQNTGAELYDTDGKTESPSTRDLYHRYGEGYILQNTWVTSDASPNDPFRTHSADGQADILKRVPEGTYIMEEVHAPSGYTRALPVGITVKETAGPQSVKMVDRTTKLEIAKVDGQTNYRVNVLSLNEGGQKIGTQEEGAASYTYEPVPGAVLALYPAKRVYTGGSHLEKTSLTPFTYRSSNWKQSAPFSDIVTCQWTIGTDSIYLERLPQGEYILEEISVPAGFVKAAPVEITVSTETEVKEVVVNDDHTKLEIEKYYIDTHTSAKKLLSGASFEIHEAETDGSGKVQYNADGTPKYKTAVLSAWTTSDNREWMNFITVFESAYAAHGTDTTSVGWTDGKGASRTAVRKSLKQLDQTLSGGVPAKYPASAVMIFQDDLGREIRISVTGSSYARVDYQFDRRVESLMGERAESYTAASGIRRFNYLDPAKKYVAVETAAPAGYMRALPQVIILSETADIQRLSIENRPSQLIVSKVLEGHTKEAVGATFSLYRAEGSALIKDAAHLVETWQTGMDGTYTEDDLMYGRIYPGYAVGDLRPHGILNLAAGTYYIVEEKAPAYYKAVDPVKVTYTDLSEAKFERVTDCPVTGKLVLQKFDENLATLSGAAFLVRRYAKNNYLVPDWENTFTLSGSVLAVTDLPVGVKEADGTITPYRYTVTELLPPTGYQIDPVVYTWEFDPDNAGVPYGPGVAAEHDLTVHDKKTSVILSKKDLYSAGTEETDAAYVGGAELTIYELSGIDGNGDPVYDETSPLRTITTAAAVHDVQITGLPAGKSYVVAETVLPDGYERMEKAVFAISSDGRKITDLSDKLSVLTFHSVSDGDVTMDTVNRDRDSVMSVKLTGRYATGTFYRITDMSGILMETFPGGYDHDILLSSGYADGAVYSITEYTSYSDGTEKITDSKTQPLIFDANGKLTLHTRTVEKVNLAVLSDDGTLIGDLDCTSFLFEKTLENSILPENPLLTMTQTGKKENEPLETPYAVIHTVRIVNPSHRESSALLTITHGPGVSVIDAGEGTVSGSVITFSAPAVPGYGTKIFTYMTKLTGTEDRADAVLQIAGRTIVSSKTVPAELPNTLTVSHVLTGSGKQIYADETAEFTIRLFHHTDKTELSGIYPYSGSFNGVLRSGDTVALKGNEYIRISTGAYKDVDYTVTRRQDGRAFTEYGTFGNLTDKKGASATFVRDLSDTSEHAVFRKGGTYDAVETTVFTDGEKQRTNRLRFMVGEETAAVSGITVFDGKTAVRILKVDQEGSLLPGCDLELYDESDNLILSWTTGTEPEVFDNVLVSGKRYRLHERKAREGYIPSRDIFFTVSGGSGRDEIIMVNMPEPKIIPDPDPPGPDPPVPPVVPTPDPPIEPTPDPPVPVPDPTEVRITIRKVDPNGSPLPGARFSITDSGGRPLAIISSSEGTEFTVETSYPEELTIVEEKAPEGYKVSGDPRKLIIDKEGNVAVCGMDPAEAAAAFYRSSEEGCVFCLVNEKKPKGKITASYRGSFTGGVPGGWFDTEGKWHRYPDPFRPFGDNFPMEILMLIAAACLAVLLIILEGNRRNKNRCGSASRKRVGNVNNENLR